MNLLDNLLEDIAFIIQFCESYDRFTSQIIEELILVKENRKFEVFSFFLSYLFYLN